MNIEQRESEKQMERLKSFDLTIKLMLILLLLASRISYLYGFPFHVYMALAGTALIGFMAKMGMFWLISRKWII